jgi:tetratricopeptide (TPR) repeat protein
MKKSILTAVFFLATLFATAQTQFEQGMTKAFGLWKSGNPTEAAAMFERIASAEKDSWLPNYYIALVNTTTAFQTLGDKQKITGLLDKAQAALDIEFAKNPNNAEILALQALIYTAWIASDPMTNGMKLSGKVIETYAKAEKIDPNNPRVVFGKAEFEIGGARYFKQDTKPMCAQIEKAITLFSTFKPETPFHPNWGLDRALEAQKECNAK